MSWGRGILLLHSIRSPPNWYVVTIQVFEMETEASVTTHYCRRSFCFLEWEYHLEEMCSCQIDAVYFYVSVFMISFPFLLFMPCVHAFSLWQVQLGMKHKSYKTAERSRVTIWTKKWFSVFHTASHDGIFPLAIQLTRQHFFGPQIYVLHTGTTSTQ